MRLLSRKEEIIMLAIWKLQDNAYGVTIRAYIEKMTGSKWLFGAIYNPLGKLLNRGYVESFHSEPKSERGGRRKIMYKLTNDGKKALITVREINSAMWLDVPPLTEKI